MTKEVDDVISTAVDKAIREAIAAGVAEGRRLQHQIDVAAFGSDSYKLWWAKQGSKPGYLDSYYRSLVIERLKAVEP